MERSSFKTKPKTSFQEELAATMKDRRARGLTADITPSPSVHDDNDSDDLGSDDELLAQFGLTSKTPEKRKPEKPTGKSSEVEDIIFGRKNLNKDDKNERNVKSSPSPFGQQTWKAPAMQNSNMPSLRRTPVDDTSDKDDSPRPKPRSFNRAPSKDEYGKGDMSSLPDGADNKSRSKTPDNKSRSKTPEIKAGSKTPENKSGSKTPDNKSRPKTPIVDIFSSGRRSSVLDRDDEEDEDDKKIKSKSSRPSSRVDSTSRSSTPKVDSDRAINSKSPSGRKSSVIDVIEQSTRVKPGTSTPKSLMDDHEETGRFGSSSKTRKSPRATPKSFRDDDEEGGLLESSPKMQRSARLTPKSFDEDHLESGSYAPTPKTRKSPNLSFGARDNSSRPTRRRQLDENQDDDDDYQETERVRPRPRSRKLNKAEDRESSICREVEKDPMMQEKREDEKVEIKIRKKPQTQEHGELDDLIDRIAAVQDDEDALSNTMRYIQPDKQQKERSAESRPQSVDLRKPKPQPRYSRPSTSSSPVSDASFESTDCIRQAVYDEWYKTKLQKIKKDKLEKQKKENEENERKKKEATDKKLESQATYQSWLNTKRETSDVEWRKKNKKAENEEKQKIREAEEKKKDAELSYKSWKERKDGEIKEKATKTKKELNKTQREKDDEEKSKKKGAASAYDGWKKKKDDLLKQKTMEDRKTKKEELKELEATRKQREKEADDTYETWMEKKENQHRKEKIERRRNKLIEAENPRPAWSPANKTIPFRK